MVRVALASAALLFTASAASAQMNTPATQENAAATPVQTADKESTTRQSTTGDPNRRVCRTQVATGSRLAGARVCKTAREWEEQRIAAKAELDRMQTNRGLDGQ